MILDALLALLCVGLTVALVSCTRRRLRAEEELRTRTDDHRASLARQSEELTASTYQLLDALRAGIIIVAPDGRLEWINRHARSLFGSREITGRLVEEAFLGSALVEPVRQALDSRSAVSCQVSMPSGALSGGLGEDTGESHWMLDISPVQLGGGAPRLVIKMRDITPSVHADQIRKDFVANASHELRTPLTIIGGYIENLLEDDFLDEPEAARHMLGIMRKHVLRINRIVEDMLLISRLENGEDSLLNITPFNLEDCINDVVKRLESLIQKQKASVEVRVPDPDLTLEGDRFYWTQVLFNLVENALKQNSSTPVRILIEASLPEDGRLRLEVVDNGRGIPAADLPYIFKRFFRVEKHHSQEEIKGTGLGLSIVKRAVEAHHGTISASSTPGVETRFTISVPLASPDLPAGGES